MWCTETNCLRKNFYYAYLTKSFLFLFPNIRANVGNLFCWLGKERCHDNTMAIYGNFHTEMKMYGMVKWYILDVY